MAGTGLTGRALIERLGLPPDADTVVAELEKRYHDAIRLGFLGPREGERLRARHLDDALGLAVLRRPAPGERWADLGSGAGLPGLPLAAVFPETAFTLIDSQRRRLEWVRSTAAEMGISNLTVVHERLEDFGRGEARAGFDVAVARALGPTTVVAELALPTVRVRGELIVPRGNLSPEERQALRTVSRKLGGGAPRVTHNVAAVVDPPGVVIMITKTATTPMRFPRKPGVPQRQPLA